jgi:anti-sigma factor RsiW
MRLSCGESRDLFLDYRVGGLNPASREALLGHLSTCGACALAYFRLENDVVACQEVASEPPPAAVRHRLRQLVQDSVQAAARRSDVPPRRWRRLLAFPVPAYAVALAVGIALLAVGVATRRQVSREAPAFHTRVLLTGYDASRVTPLAPGSL